MKQQIKEEALRLLKTSIDKIFVDLHVKFKTASGDISSDQLVKLEELQGKLIELMTEQVYQNLPEMSFIDFRETRTIADVDDYDVSEGYGKL